MKLEEMAEHYVEKYDSIKAVIAYGSRVCGVPDATSHFDFWFIVEDYNEFYGSNMRDRRSLVNLCWFDEKQAHVVLNEVNPSFYQEEFEGIMVKYGVVSLADFVRYCQPGEFRMYVKGRMQKPVRVVYAEDDETRVLVERSIKSAQKDGLKRAVILTSDDPAAFDLTKLGDFIYETMRLSYRADMRLDKKGKEKSIYEHGNADLWKIYLPLYHEVVEEIPKSKSEQRGLRFLYLANIWFNKFFSLAMNIKNGFTNKFAVSYAGRKAAKWFRSRKD